MLWIFILNEFKSLSHKPRSRWDYVMLQYAVIGGLIQFALLLVQISNITIGKSNPHHDRASPMLYCWNCSSFTNSSPHIDLPRLRTLIRQSLCALAHWGLLKLFCFLESGFLAAILPYKSAWQSLLLTVDVDIFFMTLVQLFNDVWSSQSSICLYVYPAPPFGI